MKSDLAGYLVSLSIGVVIGLLLMVAIPDEPLRPPEPIRVPVRVYPTSLVCYVQPYDGKDDVPADAIPAKVMDLPSDDLGWRACWAAYDEDHDSTIH